MSSKIATAERLPQNEVYKNTLDKRQEPRQELIQKVISRIELLMQRTPTQGDLFDGEKIWLYQWPNPIRAIEDAVKEYESLIIPTAADYVYIMEKFDVPMEVNESYIAYRQYLIKTWDTVGRIKNCLDAWIEQSIIFWKTHNKTFHQALDIGYQTWKYGNIRLKDFFQKNKMYYDSVLKSMIPYLVYKHTWQLPVWKIIKDPVN